MCSGLDLVHTDTCMDTQVLCRTSAPLPHALVEKPPTWKPASQCLRSLFTQP